ncbi:MAG: IS1/IS1595 family N-terminal zinc-binding domain-containing protein, partial [Xenococcaceae cyanobacterium]
MQCPRCASVTYRKNGRVNGKQRYLCKACGRQFFDLSLSSIVPEKTERSGDRNSFNSSEQFDRDSSIESNSFPKSTERDLGISVLLLDIENLKLEIETEKYLTALCKYPLQVKIAFANWRSASLTKQDIELHERGYQLIHVPGGQDSADGKAIAIGSSIFFQYPNIREIFVCSSDYIFTHLANELSNKGIVVYRVKRVEQIISIENRSNGKINYFSLATKQEVPDWKKLIEKIEEILKIESNSIDARQQKLSNLTNLVRERYNLEFGEPKTFRANIDPSNSKQESVVRSNINAITEQIDRINSKEELEQALITIIKNLNHQSTAQQTTISRLSAELKIVYGETGNTIVKRLKINPKIMDFLESSPKFTLKQ